MIREFKEEQKFTQRGLWIIMIVLGLFTLYEIYNQIILDEPIGNNPLSNFELIIFSVCVFCFIAMFWILRLTTRIDSQRIRLSFYPFIKRNVSWRDVKSVEVVNYGFIGGWGIRMFTKYGIIYNTRGNMGLAIELKNGKKFLIGTQKETELTELLKNYQLSNG